MRDYSISAERALLGAVLLDPAGQHEVLDLVEPGDMFRPWHAQVLAAMQRVRGRGVLPDPAQVYQELRSDPDLPACLSADPLAGLMEAAPRAAHAPAYAVMVVEGGIRQRLDLAAARLVHVSGTGELDAALRQAAQVRSELTACRARWLALPGHLRSELPAPCSGVRGDTEPGRRVEAVPEGLARARPEDPAAEAPGVRALRDLAAAPSQLAQVRGWLLPGHFAQAGHGELYAVMQDMDKAGKPVDAVTIAWEAARRGMGADPGSLADGTGPLAVASAREVHRHGMLAQADQTGKDIRADAASLACSPRELLQFADDRLRALEAQPQPGLGLRATPAFLLGVRSGPVGSPRDLDVRRCDDQPCRFRSACGLPAGGRPGSLPTDTGDSDDEACLLRCSAYPPGQEN